MRTIFPRPVGWMSLLRIVSKRLETLILSRTTKTKTADEERTEKCWKAAARTSLPPPRPPVTKSKSNVSVIPASIKKMAQCRSCVYVAENYYPYRVKLETFEFTGLVLYETAWSTLQPFMDNMKSLRVLDMRHNKFQEILDVVYWLTLRNCICVILKFDPSPKKLDIRRDLWFWVRGRTKWKSYQRTWDFWSVRPLWMYSYD